MPNTEYLMNKIYDTNAYVPIKQEYHYAGELLRQVFREGDYAIYERCPRMEEDVESVDWSVRYGEPTSWEVVVVRRDGEKVFGGVTYPPRETYPSASQWGTFGWTVMGSYTEAMEFLESRAQKALSLRTKK